MDATSRLLAPYLEKALGVTVTVENVDEANGWSGWTQAITAAPDGYTQVYANYPQMITDYLNPTNNISYTFRDLEAADQPCEGSQCHRGQSGRCPLQRF